MRGGIPPWFCLGPDAGLSLTCEPRLNPGTSAPSQAWRVRAKQSHTRANHPFSRTAQRQDSGWHVAVSSKRARAFDAHAPIQLGEVQPLPEPAVAIGR